MRYFGYKVMDEKSLPIQMTPLMDIVFIILIFFMTISVFYQMESELGISVPKARYSKSAQRSPGEIIINIMKNGDIIVNQKKITDKALENMLRRISSLFPNQPVIIRADKKAYHEYVVRVLDACASANIWNIAFATIKEKK